MFKARCIRKMKGNYTLHLANNKHNKRILFYILCGYKKELYPSIFTRIDKYFNIDADVCLVTSGKFDQEIYDMAEKRGWCYLSTTANNVCLAQNATIVSFPSAELIIKMDEDIFVTQNTFNNLLENYYAAKKQFNKIAFVAPTLNVGGYTSPRLISLTNKTNCLNPNFASLKEPCYNIDFVKFMWNINDDFVSIDEANSMLSSNGTQFNICKQYFSIGMILFERKFWNKIGYFSVWWGNGMGLDEQLVNNYSKIFGYKKIICNNVVCGHFSFGPTNKEMMEIYQKHPEKF